MSVLSQKLKMRWEGQFSQQSDSTQGQPWFRENVKKKMGGLKNSSSSYARKGIE